MCSNDHLRWMEKKQMEHTGLICRRTCTSKCITRKHQALVYTNIVINQPYVKENISYTIPKKVHTDQYTSIAVY